jgi:hypothetical protein
MLFPNHPAYAEMRPGMGLAYMPGANALGYQPGAHALLGYAAPAHDLGYLPGANALGGLGDLSQSMETAAINAGVAQQSDLDLLNSLGATDIDLENLIQGIVTLPQLYAQYGVTISPGSTAIANTTPSATPIVYNAPAQGPSPAAAGQVPSGSTLLYVASFQSYNKTGADVIAFINQNLGGHGMSVISSQVTNTSALGTSPTSIQMTVLDSVGHALLTDAKSILDSLANSASGGLSSSSLNIVAYGAQSASPGIAPSVPGASATTLTQWFESNAGYIGLGVVALVFGSAMIHSLGGKRR